MPADPAHAASIDLLTCADLSARLKIHRGSIWRMASLSEAGLPCNGFPRPLRLGPKTVRWRAVDVAAYLDALAGGGARP